MAALNRRLRLFSEAVPLMRARFPSMHKRNLRQEKGIEKICVSDERGQVLAIGLAELARAVL